MSERISPIELFEKVGRELYGNQWQTDLARALKVSARTVRHWRTTGEVPEARWRDLRQLCADRSKRLHMAQLAIGSVLETSR